MRPAAGMQSGPSIELVSMRRCASGPGLSGYEQVAGPGSSPGKRRHNIHGNPSASALLDST